MRRIIGTDQLTINDIPDENANWHEASLFALSFDPMLELGTTDIYKIRFSEFNEESSIQQLRTSLFLLQRTWNHIGEIDANGLGELRQLLILIRKKIINNNAGTG